MKNFFSNCKLPSVISAPYFPCNAWGHFPKKLSMIWWGTLDPDALYISGRWSYPTLYQLQSVSYQHIILPCMPVLVRHLMKIYGRFSLFHSGGMCQGQSYWFGEHPDHDLCLIIQMFNFCNVVGSWVLYSEEGSGIWDDFITLSRDGRPFDKIMLQFLWSCLREQCCYHGFLLFDFMVIIEFHAMHFICMFLLFICDIFT